MNRQLCASAVLSAVFAVLPLFGEVRLASGGKTDFTIVGPENPIPDEKAAVRDLKDYLTRITGAKFTVDGDAPHKIYVGRKAPGDKKPLAEFERRVRCENGDVYIYGNPYNWAGNTFAVYDFLEKFFNCRWYTFYGDECIPEKKNAVFADLTLNVVPSFDHFGYFGNFYSQENFVADAFRRRARIYDFRLRGPLVRLGSTYSHTPSRYIPSGEVKFGSDSPVYGPYKYFKDKKYLKTNPEFFSKTRRGEPNWQYQLCYSNPGLRKELIKNYLYIVEREYKGGPARVLVDLNDKGKAGMPVCYCKECAKLNEKYGDPCGAFWDFVLEICKVFRDKYPDIQLQAPVYQMTRDVPTKFRGKLPSNLAVSFAPLDETDFLKPYDVNSPAACRMIEEWRRVIGGKIAIWIYPTVYPRPLYTRPLVANIDRLVRNMRYLHKLGVNEPAAEFGGGPLCTAGFNELRVYLLSCLVRDIDADVPALIKDFMEHYYGAAAPLMTKYLAELEKCEKDETNFMRWWPDHRSVLTYLTPANLLKWQSWFDEMEKRTEKDAKANLHVRRARMNLDEATMSVWYKFAPGEMPDRDMMKKRHDKTAIESAADLLATYRPVTGVRTTPERFAKWDERSINYHHALAGKWRELPEKFAKLPKGDVKRAVPCVNNRKSEFYPGASTGIAVKGELKDKINCTMYIWTAPPVEYRYAFRNILKPEKIKAQAGKGYRYYYVGTTRLWPDCYLMFGFGGAPLGFLYDAKDPKRKYEVYLSLKLNADGKTLFCDEVLLAKTGKPSTLTYKNLFSGAYPWPYDKKTGKRVY